MVKGTPSYEIVHTPVVCIEQVHGVCHIDLLFDNLGIQVHPWEAKRDY